MEFALKKTSLLGLISSGLVVAMFLTLFSTFTFSTPASAVPRTNEKVTICHRTHATTNPYRKITVSMSSIIGNGNSGNGHGGVNHNPYNINAGTVFNPGFNYPNNAKEWQDIIPPFTYQPSNGNPGTFAGLNWTAEGRAIYYGLVLNGVDYSGLCSQMGAREFANLELESKILVTPNPNNGQLNTMHNDIRGDLREQEADGDGTINASGDISSLPTVPQKPKGGNRPIALSNRIQTLNTYNSANPNSIRQSLAGVVWKDLDSDGIQDQGEEAFSSVGITVIDPQTNLPIDPSLYSLVNFQSKKKSIYSFALSTNGSTKFRTITSTVTVQTDSNGYFEVPSLPEGEWQVVVSTPDGWTYTYDSSGTNDGLMPGTYVPAGGVGFAWAGLVYTGSSSGSGSGSGSSTSPASALAKTGVSSVAPVIGIVGFIVVGLGIALLVARRRENQ